METNSNFTTSSCSNDSWMSSAVSATAVADGRFCSETDLENDNTVSEELSRFSSPSQSQSSSCTSITNPFYDGPANFSENSITVEAVVSKTKVVGKMEEAAAAKGRRTSQRLSTNSQRKRSTVSGTLDSEDAASLNMIASIQTQTLHSEEKIMQRVIIIWDLGYVLTCQGFLQFLQLVMTVAALVCLVSSGAEDGGLLNLPLSWHFRIMLFVLVLTLLVTAALFFGNCTSLISIFGMEWTFFDMVVYSLFAFLYLVGSSLVASAFDFYEKMKTDVSKETINQLVTSVILGYICMLLNGITAFISYRKWKIQYRLYHRRKLIEEDEIDL